LMKKYSAGFTLIELLVVIAIIALLSSLALPRILKTLVKGQMTQTLSNGNQLYLATQTMAMDATTAGSSSSGWPGDAAVPSFSTWATALCSGYVSTNEFCKLSSAPGVPVVTLPNVARKTAFKVYPVQENSESDAIFLITRNATVHGSGHDVTITLDPAVKPYGNQGCVIIHRGGDGVILLPQQLTNSPMIGSVSGSPLE
jgi:prepilin-type N-terminal cleavage/methylation domain-containing protein